MLMAHSMMGTTMQPAALPVAISSPLVFESSASEDSGSEDDRAKTAAVMAQYASADEPLVYTWNLTDLPAVKVRLDSQRHD